MTSSYYHFKVYKYCILGKNAYNNSLCNLSSIKIQLLMILKKYLLTELEKNKKNKILKKAIAAIFFQKSNSIQ